MPIAGGGPTEAGVLGRGAGAGPVAAPARATAFRAPAQLVRRDGRRRDPREAEEVPRPLPLLLLPEAGTIYEPVSVLFYFVVAIEVLHLMMIPDTHERRDFAVKMLMRSACVKPILLVRYKTGSS